MSITSGDISAVSVLVNHRQRTMLQLHERRLFVIDLTAATRVCLDASPLRTSIRQPTEPTMTVVQLNCLTLVKMLRVCRLPIAYRAFAPSMAPSARNSCFFDDSVQVTRREQESPANAKGTRDSSACMKAHCEQM